MKHLYAGLDGRLVEVEVPAVAKRQYLSPSGDLIEVPAVAANAQPQQYAEPVPYWLPKAEPTPAANLTAAEVQQLRTALAPIRAAVKRNGMALAVLQARYRAAGIQLATNA